MLSRDPMIANDAMGLICKSRIHYLALVIVVGSTANLEAAPSAAMKAACAGDRQRLCHAFVGNPSDMQKCMQAHRAEWSANCAAEAPHGTNIAAHKTAASGSNKGGGAPPSKGPGTGTRREKCAAYVQARYFVQGEIAHHTEAPAALRRCMQGEQIDESNYFPSWGAKTW